MILNIEDSEHLSGGKGKRFFINPMEFVNRFQHIMNRNSLKKSRENISFHYDLNNDFFQSFLDSTMTYSSALYTDKNMSLEEAQNAKYQNLCDNLELKRVTRF
jgi:cyclopropane-fatty-acyl-phospholipid synthase